MVSIDYRVLCIPDNVPPSQLVQTFRIWSSCSDILLSSYAVGRIRRFTCRILLITCHNCRNLTISAGCNLEHGWRRWKTSLGLDLQFVSLFLRLLAVKPIITVVLEGLATFLAGAASFWIIQDFPDTAKFLTEAERIAIIHRLQSDNQFSAGGETFKLKYILKSILDWKTWIGSESPGTFCDWSWLLKNYAQ